MPSPASPTLRHAPDDAAAVTGDDLAELSAELRQVEWLGLDDPAAARPHARLIAHTADHWSFELSLVVFGALLGVALYFGVS